uniref:Uncharacterized protein n=1 Tax=Romanomermis culicivorax TaxID=13658 RepID=A0A915K3P5_ROMCU
MGGQQSQLQQKVVIENAEGASSGSGKNVTPSFGNKSKSGKMANLAATSASANKSAVVKSAAAPPHEAPPPLPPAPGDVPPRRQNRPKKVPPAGHTCPVMPADDDPTMPVDDDLVALKMLYMKKVTAAVAVAPPIPPPKR